MMNRRVFLGGIVGAGALGCAASSWMLRSPRSARSLGLWTNGMDYVVAEDVTHARLIVAQAYEYEFPLSQESLEEIDWEGWQQYSSDETLELLVADQHVAKSASEWTGESEPGYLACSEY